MEKSCGKASLGRDCTIPSLPIAVDGLPSSLLEARGVLPQACEVSYVGPFQNSFGLALKCLCDAVSFAIQDPMGVCLEWDVQQHEMSTDFALSLGGGSCLPVL